MTMTFALAALAAAQVAAPQASVVQEPPQLPKVATTDPEGTVSPQLLQAPWQAPLPAAQEAPAITAPAVVPAQPATQVVVTPDATNPTGLILWRNIVSGMPVAQLRGLYPQGSNVHYKPDRTILSDVPILEGCQAKVNILHTSGVVQEIVMRGEGSFAGRCSLKLITALSGKYGESLEKDKVRGSLFAREGKNYVWTRDGATLQFKRYTNGPMGGAGLFAASWELRYSATATNIDL